MPSVEVQLTGPMPYFAEIPYYLWGQVDYDSEGDCQRPSDRNWSELSLENRETSEAIDIRCKNGDCQIDGNQNTVDRVAALLVERSGAFTQSPLPVSGSDHTRGLRRARVVAAEFGEPTLKPFDSHPFWGSWKWIGWYATEFTWVGRWIMHSVVRGDVRAVPLCIEWLKSPPLPQQVDALCYALGHLTGEHLTSAAEWIRWYDGGLFRKGAKSKYPTPDLDAWLRELKGEYSHLT